MNPLDPMNILEMDSVSLSYRKSRKSAREHQNQILDNVSINITEGETLGVIGKNGAGKSTLLRLMAGIFKPDEGVVRRDVDKKASLLTIALGFRQDLSGRDNALLSAMLQGYSKAEALSILDEIKEFSELKSAYEQPVKTYSSGMRSRLGFTTALLTRVDILLIDEVLSVGDASFREKAKSALREKIDSNLTVVYVSHSASQVEELCARAIWINEAKIQAEGPTEEVIARYHSSFNLKRNR